MTVWLGANDGFHNVIDDKNSHFAQDNQLIGFDAKASIVDDIGISLC